MPFLKLEYNSFSQMQAGHHYLGNICAQDLHRALRLPLRPELVIELAHVLGVLAQTLVGPEAQVCGDVPLVRSEPVNKVLPTGDRDLDRLGGSSLDGLGQVEQSLRSQMSTMSTRRSEGAQLTMDCASMKNSPPSSLSLGNVVRACTTYLATSGLLVHEIFAFPSPITVIFPFFRSQPYIPAESSIHSGQNPQKNAAVLIPALSAAACAIC
jgi:hypothetical protein